MTIKKVLGCISVLIASSLIRARGVMAQTKRWEDISAECTINGVATIQGLVCLLANIFSVVLALLGIAGFVMLVFGSITWMLSGSNSQGVDSAKKTITYSFLGLALALCSYMIINIIAQFTGVNVIKEFIIPPSNTGLPGGPTWQEIVNSSGSTP